VFKGIDIKLSGPICDCDERDISWFIIEGPGLGLKCDTCKVELRIPRSKFKAAFTLDRPYPNKTELKEKPELKSLDGGKVLEFKSDVNKNENTLEEK